MTPEAKVKKRVVARLEKVDAYHFFPATHGYGASGVPDIVACVRGHFIGIECKAGKNKPTALQEDNLLRIFAAGGVALVINETNLKELDDMLALLTKTGETQ